jgi:peroxiredoxin
VLYDVGAQVINKYRLAFVVDERLKPIYKGFGIDIPAHNGDQTYVLPVPATYIIGQDGMVKHAFLDVNHTKRMEPAEIIEKLKSL